MIEPDIYQDLEMQIATIEAQLRANERSIMHSLQTQIRLDELKPGAYMQPLAYLVQPKVPTHPEAKPNGGTKRGITNCPNCGAPIRGESCEYCGTMFWGG